MKSLVELLLANIRLRPARTALAAFAVIASSCVVVWVVSGYDALLAQSIDEEAAEALGRFDLVVSSPTGGGPGGGGGSGAGAGRGASAGGRPGSTSIPTVGPGGGPRSAEAGSGGPRGAGGSRGGRRGGAGVGPDGRSHGLSPRLVASLRNDDQVAEANLTTQSRVSMARVTPDPDATPVNELMRDDRPPVNGMPPLSPPLIGTDAKEEPYELTAGRWIDPVRADRSEGVLSANYATTLKARVGDELNVVAEVGQFRVKVVGIIEQPQAPGGGGRGGGGGGTQSGLFVTIPQAEAINGFPARIGQVNIVLREGIDPTAFSKALTHRLSQIGSEATVTDIQALKQRLAQGLSQSGSRALAYSATGIALMAALFIIFTTLSMGVTERSRELAVLRAVGLTRGQVAGLVFLEGLVLALLGWAGGLLAGWGLLAIASRAKPDLFTEGVRLGWWCIGLTGVAAVGGALMASLLPAWRATRVMPLDAMAPPRVSPPGRWIAVAALVGLALLAINPLLTHVPSMSRDARMWAYSLVGYPSMVLGFVLLAPWLIVAVEKVAAPVVARLLGLPPKLLSSLLSANLWRTLGTSIALTVGLGLYIATQIWGSSMLGPFMPGDWVPELLIGFEPAGLPDDQVEAVKQVKGVNSARTLAMAVDQPRLVKPMEGNGGFMMTQDNVVLMGVDPDLAFGGGDPVIDVSFAAGSRDAALAKLKAGQACIVPDYFLDAAGLKLGDSLELVPPDAPPGTVVRYEIAAAVELPGWQWITKMTGLRRRMTRTGAMVFAPFADVRRDFGLKGVNFFWLDTDGSVSSKQVESAMQKIAESHGESHFQVAGVGEVISRRPYARVTSSQAVRDGIRDRADGMIWGMSQLPLVTLLITSLAVVNTIVSSVRARRWDLGILRALGTTRGGLVRLILAESILIGLVVCALGLAFGLMAGWCGTGMSPYLSPFGGFATPLVIPWSKLALGLGTALTLGLLSALWPAFTTGRAEPLRLLKAGRGAA